MKGTVIHTLNVKITDAGMDVELTARVLSKTPLRTFKNFLKTVRAEIKRRRKAHLASDAPHATITGL